MRIRFGTDGWRGVMSRDFTYANVRRVVAAVAGYLEARGEADRGLAVGYDRRFGSEGYATEAARVLAARGIRVWLAPEPVPTPLVSWAVRHLGLAGGIVITASHNPPEWNGIKFKEAFGGSARPAVSGRIEDRLAGVPDGDAVPCADLGAARRDGLVTPLDVWDAYRAALWSFVDRAAIGSAGLRVAVDAMHGTGSPWLARLLEEAGCEVVPLRAAPDPGFGGMAPEPLEAHLGGLMAAVPGRGCALGVANDGDADRIGAVDERGAYFSAQRIFAVLLHHLYEDKALRGRVVLSVSGTAMAEALAAPRGLAVDWTPIGFKHIGEALLGDDTLIGGEESGGIGVPAFGPERDGLLNALLLVEGVARGGRGLRAWLDEVFAETGYFTYVRRDLPLPAHRADAVRRRIAALADPDALADRAVVRVRRVDGVRFERDDGSWLLVRASGTEPKLRLYAEARSKADAASLLDAGRRLVGDAVA